MIKLKIDIFYFISCTITQKNNDKVIVLLCLASILFEALEISYKKKIKKLRIFFNVSMF